MYDNDKIKQIAHETIDFICSKTDEPALQNIIILYLAKLVEIQIRALNDVGLNDWLDDGKEITLEISNFNKVNTN